MFWDKISPLYDLFENVYNRKVYNNTGKHVAALIDADVEVLECACGTGAISRHIASKCKKLVATDLSKGMLKQAKKKCRAFSNTVFEEADITQLRYSGQCFDAAVAGNVIHLLPQPDVALKELQRVVKPGGKLILPTYINQSKDSSRLAVKFLELLGASFKRQFDLDSYKTFFEGLGCQNVEYDVVDGRMPCAIAVIPVPYTK